MNTPSNNQIFQTVEAALSWAYIDELPKQRDTLSLGSGPQSYPKISPMFRGAALGTTVDESRDPGFPSSLGDPHPDALVIQRTVERLRTEADSLSHDGLQLDAGLEGFNLDVDAVWREALKGLLSRLITKAVLRDRPDVSAELPRPKPRQRSGQTGVWRKATAWQEVWQGNKALQAAEDARRAEEGLPPVDRARRPPVAVETEVASPAMKGGQYRKGSYCGLIYEPHPNYVLLDRAEYGAWRQAMDWLEAELQAQGFEVRPCTAARRPWLGEQDLPENKPELLLDTTPDPFAHLRAKGIRGHYAESTARRAGARPAVQRHSPVRHIPVSEYAA